MAKMPVDIWENLSEKSRGRFDFHVTINTGAGKTLPYLAGDE
jgi:hypothetical protein